jgi:type II secretory ATPase GspE/PulE/Tfp pilus assembly ATPase PilB-like protein
MVIAEVVPIDDDLRSMILDGSTMVELQKYIDGKGYLNLKQDGILKVVEKKTTLLEIERVIS